MAERFTILDFIGYEKYKGAWHCLGNPVSIIIGTGECECPYRKFISRVNLQFMFQRETVIA